MTALFGIGKQREPLYLAIVDLEGHFQHSQPIVIVRELELVDELAPREEPGPVDLGAAEEDDVLLVLANRVVEVKNLPFLERAVAIWMVDVVGDETWLDILDHMSGFQLRGTRPLDRCLEVKRDEQVLPGLLNV